MKAIIINEYGTPDVLRYTEIDPPSPTEDQLLIKVYASSVNPVDWKIRRGMLKVVMGNKFPLRLGSDFSGEVVAVGEKLQEFQSGDQVYGFVTGSYGEYIVASPNLVCLKPSNLSHEQAAAFPLAASTALQALRNMGKIKNGQKVLINGASGGVGTFAVQIAKAYETQVTAVCSGKNIALVQQLGADHVIDYTQTDFTQTGEKYDIIFDAVSNSSFSSCQKSLSNHGIYITLLPNLDFFLNRLLTIFSGQKVEFFLAKSKTEDLQILKDLIEQGKLNPIIDRIYPLSDIIAAHTYSEEGHTVGKIVIKIG